MHFGRFWLYIVNKREPPYSFSRPRSSDFTIFENLPGPFPLAFFAEVPLDDVADFALARQANWGSERIVGRIKACKEFSGNQTACFFQHSLQKRDEFTLAELISF